MCYPYLRNKAVVRKWSRFWPVRKWDPEVGAYTWYDVAVLQGVVSRTTMETDKNSVLLREPLNVETHGAGLVSSYSCSQRNMISRTGASVLCNPSPPAQAYFESPHDGTSAPIAADSNAGSYFAYSTTLKRHGVGDSPTSGRSLSLEAAGVLVDEVQNNSRGNHEGSGGRAGLEGGYGAEAVVMGLEPMRGKQADDTVSGKSDPIHGLPSASVSPPRATYGYNEFSVSAPEPVWLKFAKTIYESHLILLLFGSAAVSPLMGNLDDAVSIAVAILIVVTVGFVQERRSEESLAALNKLVPHHCRIIRDGHQLHLLANELVPGDIVTFQVGDRIPADLCLLTTLGLEIDESSLTGKTRSSRKNVVTYSPSVLLGERSCIEFMGTLVQNGRGTDIEEKRTSLQASMDELAQKLSILRFDVIGVICFIGVMQKRGWLEIFTIGARRKAIVKKLPSVEALGSASVICSDKADYLGTTASTHATPATKKTLEIGGICNNVFRNNEEVNVGQSTDVAVLNVFAEFGVKDERRNFTRTDEHPFSSETKSMAVTGRHDAPRNPCDVYYIEGALDATLPFCQFYHVAGDATPVLEAGVRQTTIAHEKTSAKDGLCVVGTAYAYLPPNGTASLRPGAGAGPSPSNLIFTSFGVMLDPLVRGPHHPAHLRSPDIWHCAGTGVSIGIDEMEDRTLREL
ncbi:hypothetical protein BDV93DRAFT_508732 [Ceratobasidium sp. AG-I]|nr:hypothetical protein BDV93DRAFT_508732 [Ceratobasidium sp. AG-I]